MSSSKTSRKRCRESSSSLDERILGHTRKRRQKPNDHRKQRRTIRAQEAFTKTFKDTALNSTAMSHKLTNLLSKTETAITKNDYAVAYRALREIMKDKDLRSTASREELLRILNATEILGDGKRCGMEQLRVINEGRRMLMEIEAEVRVLRGENKRLAMLR